MMPMNPCVEPTLSEDDVAILLARLGRNETLRILIRMARFIDSASLVRFAYLTILGREADRDGLAFYSLLLRTRMQPLDFFDCLVGSAEFRGTAEPAEVEQGDDGGFLEFAYQRVLGRPIDESGKGNYSAQLARGISRFKILEELRNSPESRRRQMGRQALVDIIRRARRRQFWRNLLHRPIEVSLACPSAGADAARQSAPAALRSQRPMENAAELAISNMGHLQQLPPRAREIILRTAFGPSWE